MAGEKLRKVRDAVKMLLDQMQPTDFVSVVIFDDRAHVVVPSQPVSDREALKRLIDGICDGGGTTMSLGMRAGLDEVKKQLGMPAVHRIVLLTDGETYGDEDVCRAYADEARISRVTLSPMGIGSDWKEQFLDDIGLRGGGQEAEFIRTPADALALFQQQFTSAVNVVVQNAMLTVRPSQGVSARRATRVLPAISELGPSALQDRGVAVHLGDVAKDDSRRPCWWN